MNGARANVSALKVFYFDENNNYKDKYNYYFKWFPNAGFLFWTINEHEDERYFTIWQTYGDMKVIGKYIVEVMKLNDLDVIVTATHRSVRGFIKKVEHGTCSNYGLFL